jgi:hypothetical protein
LRIEYYTKSQLSGIKEIIRGINTIFPVDYLKIFSSDQLGLLINGTPFIDTEDWRMNTKYKNYHILYTLAMMRCFFFQRDFKIKLLFHSYKSNYRGG